MNYLRTASFGGLFTVTFAVAAAGQVTLSILGLLFAILAPGMFQMNGAVATSPVQAIGALLFLLVFGLFMNAGMSAIGSLTWLGVRRAFGKPRSAAST